MKSIGQKIMQLEGLGGTSAVTDWEADFIESVVEKTDGGKNTTNLTEKQLSVIDRIYGKHFA